MTASLSMYWDCASSSRFSQSTSYAFQLALWSHSISSYVASPFCMDGSWDLCENSSRSAFGQSTEPLHVSGSNVDEIRRNDSLTLLTFSGVMAIRWPPTLFSISAVPECVYLWNNWFAAGTNIELGTEGTHVLWWNWSDCCKSEPHSQKMSAASSSSWWLIMRKETKQRGLVSPMILAQPLIQHSSPQGGSVQIGNFMCHTLYYIISNDSLYLFFFSWQANWWIQTVLPGKRSQSMLTTGRRVFILRRFNVESRTARLRLGFSIGSHLG